jgi:hypothetical protein
MRKLSFEIVKRVSILSALILLLSSGRLVAQNFSFGVFADPGISWFSSNTNLTQSSGAVAGFNFGFTFNKYFSTNYAFSTGLTISSGGGKLSNPDTIYMDVKNYPLPVKVPPGQLVTYRVRYLCVPIGLKFKSKQIGYITFFTDIGIDPKVIIGGQADIPSLKIKGEGAIDELNTFNLSYHILTGIEYSLGGSTAVVFGLGYDNNFLDVTKDINNQPSDMVTQNIIKFRIGLNF